jgi:hypothetical protein
VWSGGQKSSKTSSNSNAVKRVLITGAAGEATYHGSGVALHAATSACATAAAAAACEILCGDSYTCPCFPITKLSKQQQQQQQQRKIGQNMHAAAATAALTDCRIIACIVDLLPAMHATSANISTNTSHRLKCTTGLQSPHGSGYDFAYVLLQARSRMR